MNHIGFTKTLLFIFFEVIQPFILIIAYFCFAYFLINLLNNEKYILSFYLSLIFFCLFFLIKIVSNFFEEYLKNIFKINLIISGYLHSIDKKNNIEKFTREIFEIKSFFLSLTFFFISIIILAFINLFFLCIILIILFASLSFYKIFIKQIINKTSNSLDLNRIRLNKMYKKPNNKPLIKLIKFKYLLEIKKLLYNFYFEIIALIVCLFYLIYFLNFHDNLILINILLLIVSLRFIVTAILKFKNSKQFL